MTEQDVIRKFNASLSQTSKWGTAAQDEAVYNASNGKFSNMASVVDSLLRDARNAATPYEFLRDKCGINYDDPDTGSYSGSDMNNFLVKTAESIVQEKTSPDTWTKPADNIVVLDCGLTLILPNVGTNGIDLSAQEDFILRALSSSWGNAAFNLGADATGLDFHGDASVKEMTVKLQSREYDPTIPKSLDTALAWVAPSNYDSQGNIQKLELVFNMMYYKNISLTDENGKAPGAQYADRVLGHEFVHASIFANIKWAGYLSPFVREGMPDIVVGIKDNHPELPELVSTNLDTLAKNLRDELESGDPGYNPYASGYLFFRYLAFQSADTYIKVFDGTDDAEHIRTDKDNVTISAAGGNDTIDIVDGAKNTVIKYTAGDGNDVITLNETSTLSISGAPYTSVKSGDDWIIGVGSDSITLQGAATLSTVNIAGINADDAGITLRNYMNDTLITGTPNNDSIENGSYNGNSKGGDNVTISGGGGDDHAYNMQGKFFTYIGGSGVNSVHSYQGNVATISTGANNDYVNAYQSTLLTVSGGAGNDGLHSGGGNHNSLNGDAGNDFLTLWNGETNSTILGGAGSDTLRDNGGKSNVLDGGTGNDLISISSAANDTVMLGAGNDTVKNNGSTATTYFVDSDGSGKNFITGAMAGDTIFISGNSDAETLTSDGNLIVAAGKVTVTVDGGANLALTVKVSITTLKLTNNSKSPVTLGSNYTNADASDRTKAVKIVGNSLNNSIVGGSKADTLDGGGGNNTLTGGAGKDLFIYTAGNNVITDYANGDKIKSGAKINKATVSDKTVIFTTAAGTLKINGGKGKSLDITDSKGKNYTAVVSKSNAMNITLTDSVKSRKVTLDPAIKTVDASDCTKATNITGNDSANSLVGGSGADTLNGGAGNDTLTGGSGKDLFIYTAGNDVITDYANGDKIKFGAKINKATVSGSNVIFTTAAGKLTVKNAKGQTLAITDSAGKNYSAVVSKSNAMKIMLTNSVKSRKVTLDPAIKTVDASACTKITNITGNALANKIYGGSGANTLNGGAGNDSLWGNGGNDTFIYSSGDGKDVIYGFGKNDLLQITGEFSAPTYSSKNNSVAFKVGTGSVTLRDFGSTTLFHVNDTTYQLSGGKIRAK